MSVSFWLKGHGVPAKQGGEVILESSIGTSVTTGNQFQTDC